MIKLKSILREAGLLGEQANQTQVLNVTPGDTQQQLQQQLIDSELDLTNPVTINLTFSSQLPNNGVPSSNQITQLQTTLTAIGAIGKNVSAVVNAGTTATRATGTGAPVSQFTQGGAAFARAFPNIAQAYPVTNNETSNNFLLLNRAGAIYQAAINAGIQNVTTTIPTDGTATRQQTRFATLSVTGVFKLEAKVEFAFDVAVRVPNQTELRSGRAYTIPFYVKRGYNVKMPGTWTNIGSQANFESFVSKAASGKNWSGSELDDKRFATIDPTTFAKFQTLNSLISKIDIMDYLRTNAAELSEKSFLEPWRQDKAAIGIDNVIKLFSE